MILLGVNIDHGATVRQARFRNAPESAASFVEPDPIALAERSLRAGADGITAHLREDRRHIQERDVWRLKMMPGCRLNLEMACTTAMTELALSLQPAAVCLVPESREEVTTEGGLDVASASGKVTACVNALKAAGIEVSLFVDADHGQIDAAAQTGAPVIELHTGAYANAYATPRRSMEFKRLMLGAVRAHELKLKINAGHGINYTNIEQIRTLPHLHELNIGHSIISRALFVGIDEAVREMKARINP